MKGRMVGMSPGLQLLLILLIVIGSAVFFFLLSVLFIPVFYSVPLEDVPAYLTSDLAFAGRVEIFKFIQAFNTIGTFLVPAFIGAYLFSLRPGSFIGLNKFPANAGLILFLLFTLTLSGTVISDGLYRLSKAIELPGSLSYLADFFENLEGAYQEQVGSLLEMNSFGDFAGIFLIIAILPAVSEEMLFRGVIQPVMSKGLGNNHLGIIVTSFFFALLHQQFYSFLSIMTLGIVLGYLRFWSNSIWPSIIMHLINNGTLVIAIYFFDVPVDDISEVGIENAYYLWPGILIFGLSLMGIYKFLKQ